jgi:hypothetical protein
MPVHLPLTAPWHRLIIGLTLAVAGCLGCDSEAPSNTNPRVEADAGEADGAPLDMMIRDAMLLDAEPADAYTPQPTTEYELRHDDRYAETSSRGVTHTPLTTGAQLAVGFTAPPSARLTGAHVAVAPSGSATEPIHVRVFLADGPDGAPSTELTADAARAQLETEPSTRLPFDVGWLWVPFDTPLAVADRPFFIAVEWRHADIMNAPMLGIDLSADQTRGWVKLNGEAWQPLEAAQRAERGPMVPMIRATVAVAVDERPDAPEVLTNASLYCPTYLSGALPGPLRGGWSVTRLSPHTAPFVVHTIGYELHQHHTCTATLPHQVVVFVDGPEPSNTPTVLEAFDCQVAHDSLRGAVAPVFIALSTPAQINVGQYLDVGVELPGDVPQACIGTCFTDPVAENNWFSLSGPPVFDFSTLRDAGGPELRDGYGDVSVQAYGHPLVE